jgi:hypothetical protein
MPTAKESDYVRKLVVTEMETEFTICEAGPEFLNILISYVKGLKLLADLSLSPQKFVCRQSEISDVNEFRYSSWSGFVYWKMKN